MKKNEGKKSSDKKQNAPKDKNNIIKINTDFESKNLIYTKKLKITLIITIVVFIILIIRIVFLQFVQGNSLKEMAYKQQTINQIISPKRGNIYDASGKKALAISAQVDTITINPQKISKSNDVDTKDYKEKVARALSEIFELNYDEILEKVNSNSQVETIVKNKKNIYR